MSSSSSHYFPSHQGCNINEGHHGAPHGSYINQGYHASGEGVINVNPQTTSYHHSPSNPLEELRKRRSPSAAFDSAARFDPPRCAESTRLAIIQRIEEWVDMNEDTVPSSLFWLYGGAGVGKSAVAQSISEKFQEKKQLAASFFFFRTDPSRSNGDHLIPTLVSHLIDSLKEVSPFVEAKIRENWDLFTKRYQIQLQELLIEPLLALKSEGNLVSHPRLIVIDGLDECENPVIQCELLRLIARAIPQIPYPLRFFITSRPEAHIARFFNHDPDLQAIKLHKHNLSDDPSGDTDIRVFLEKEFMEIRQVHPIGQHLPLSWPDEKAITSLIDRSSRHFIYASTVIRYIRSPNHRPDERLEVILRLRLPQEGDQPYAQLDALYAFIFEGVESRDQLEKICLVLGVVHFQSEGVGIFKMVGNTITIEKFLEMKAGDLVLLLNPILSLVAVDGGNVRILHKSLFDYLLDSARGGHLPFDLAQVHESAAIFILNQRFMKNMYHVHTFQNFAYHCQYAYLNDSLKDYLHSLDVPWPKFIFIPKLFPLWDDGLNTFMLSIIWPFFRTLSREDFDSTGQLYKQYVEKWMRYLHPAVPRRVKRRSLAAVAKMDRLKRKLDTLLMEWKPPNLTPATTVGRSKNSLKHKLYTLVMKRKSPNFNLIDGGADPRVAFIKREHSVFSSYAKASFSGSRITISSSLVFGDSFIHSYNLGIRDDMFGFLILQTYSRHDNRCYQHVHEGYDDIVEEARKEVEKYLLSDFYQKYGLMITGLSITQRSFG